MVRNSHTLIEVLELQFKWGVLYSSKLIISGSFATASCTRCKHKVTADEIREDIFAQRIPLCPRCPQVALPPRNDTENRYESYKGEWWIYHSLSVLFLSAQFCTSVPFFLSLSRSCLTRNNEARYSIFWWGVARNISWIYGKGQGWMWPSNCYWIFIEGSPSCPHSK